MTDERLAQRVTTFTQAVQRLHDAVNQPDTEFIRDQSSNALNFVMN